MTNRGAPSAVWQFFSCLNKTKQKEKKKTDFAVFYGCAVLGSIFTVCMVQADVQRRRTKWARDGMLLKAKSFFPLIIFSTSRLLRTDSLALWICVYRDKVKMFWVFWFFLDFFVFFWEVVFYILFLFLVAPYVKMITDLFKNNNDNILITNNY